MRQVYCTGALYCCQLVALCHSHKTLCPSGGTPDTASCDPQRLGICSYNFGTVVMCIHVTCKHAHTQSSYPITYDLDCAYYIERLAHQQISAAQLTHSTPCPLAPAEPQVKSCSAHCEHLHVWRQHRFATQCRKPSSKAVAVWFMWYITAVELENPAAASCADGPISAALLPDSCT